MNWWIKCLAAVCVISVLAPGGGEARADEHCEDDACRHPPVHSHERAGCPQCLAPWAIPSNTRHDFGYYVGGGARALGEPRYCNEGTWGWDYHGAVFQWVRLKWWHGRHEQGGLGQYQPDGPPLIPHH